MRWLPDGLFSFRGGPGGIIPPGQGVKGGGSPLAAGGVPLQQLRNDFPELRTADRTRAFHLGGEVLGDGAAGDGGAVRLGVSMMCPGRQTLSMWSGIHDLEPSLRFEIVPVSDLYDERESVMRSLGREVDVVQSSFSTPRWGDACQKLLIVNVPFYIDVPRTSRLARKTRITVADLEGMRLRVLRHGNDAMDSLRIDLLADGGVDVIDVDSFDFALFNDAEEKGDAVLTCGAWSGVHPAFVGVPFLCGREVPVYLHYPLEPTLQVQKFVNAMAQLLN